MLGETESIPQPVESPLQPDSNPIPTKRDHESTTNDPSEPEQKKPKTEPESIQTETNTTTEDPMNRLVYQLRVANLPKFTKGKDVEKFLKETVGLSVPGKVKKNPQWDYAFVCFQNEQDKTTALESLEGKLFKSKHALYIQDLGSKPLFRQDRDRPQNNRQRKPHDGDEEDDKEDTRTPVEKLADQVTPMWRLPYEEQLVNKTKNIEDTLGKFTKELKFVFNKVFKDKQRTAAEANKEEVVIEGIDGEEEKKEERLDAWFFDGLKENKRIPCELKPAVASPILNNYRNKCEFTFGRDLDNKKTVGFLLGLYKQGITAVLNPQECLHVSEDAKRVAASMQKYLDNSEWDCYDRTTKQGNWRMVMVRTHSTGEVMALVQIHPQQLEKEVIAAEKEKLINYFKKEQEEGNCRVDTLLFQAYDGMHTVFNEATPYEVLAGDGFIHEELFGLTFRISPTAFFQVNTPATLELYSGVKESCGLTSKSEKKTVLLDLCCGTGTIGQTMAPHCDSVIGVEMVKSATEDAERNAKSNGLNNITYIAAKVEDAMDKVMEHVAEVSKNADGEPVDVIAVLDPPRSGVHASVIRAIRECELIQKVVYVSCDANAAMNNFLELCRPTSKKYAGRPFKMVSAQPYDLFPHTKHVELLLEFVRV